VVIKLCDSRYRYKIVSACLLCVLCIQICLDLGDTERSRPVNMLALLTSYNCVYTYLLHGAESFLRGCTVFSQSRNSLHFTESEGPLPHLQVSDTCLEPLRTHFSTYLMYRSFPQQCVPTFTPRLSAAWDSFHNDNLTRH